MRQLIIILKMLTLIATIAVLPFVLALYTSLGVLWSLGISVVVCIVLTVLWVTPR